MGATFTIPLVTPVDDDIITASTISAEWQNISDNFKPSGMDDYSASDSEMQTTTDPYPSSVVSRPTSLQGELERIRWQLNQIIGKTNWYEDPSLSIEALKSAFVLTGEVRAYTGDSAPTGWLICDGTAVSRTTYSDLFALVGTRFGQGNGATTFNIPDFRGRFLRGRANGQSTDPDRASRTAMASGGATGDNVGSVQSDATALPNNSFVTDNPGNHNHNASAYQKLLRITGGGSNTPTGFDASAGELDVQAGSDIVAAGAHTHIVTSGGDNETRPENAYVNYIIKT